MGEVVQDRGCDQIDAWPMRAACGILAGTKIATPQGWRLAESLRQGEVVLTINAGAQQLAWVKRLPPPEGPELWPRAHWPLQVPVAALDNLLPLRLLPDQPVLIESDAADAIHGDPFVLIPALSLLGYRGIELCQPPDGAAAFRLGFSCDQIVYAARGAWLGCPAMRAWRQDGRATLPAGFPVLPAPQARALVSCLMAEDLGGALRLAGRAAGQATFWRGANRE